MLALVMAFAFAGLLYIQVTYIKTIMQTYSEQFNTIVKQSLQSVSGRLEKDEARYFLEEDVRRGQSSFSSKLPTSPKETGAKINELRINMENNESHTGVELGLSFRLRYTEEFDEFATPPKRDKERGSVVTTNREIQDEILERFQKHRALIEEVIYDMTRTAHLKPIEERVSFESLKNEYKEALATNGLNLPFVYSVINNDGNVVYQSEKIQKLPRASDVFTQALFPNDPPSRQSYVKIYFPTRADYLFNSISFIVPSVIFTLILLITFTVTLIIIFRQKKLSEMKNDFINNMTHELKTPVSTISLAAQMLKDSGITKSPDVFKHISGVINDETKRLGFLVEKVLQMSLFDNQRATLKQKELDANDLIAGIANTFIIKVQKYGGEIDVDLQAEDSSIYVDEMHITNVLFNLLDNAVKYRQQDVPLLLIASTWNEGGKLLISIEDNGVGIKKEYMKKVFDRFFRVPTGNVHDVKGFGLGLAYVRKIIDDHNGTIRAEAGRNNVGTKFIITLPLIKN